ncbi:MAG: hypothetical protein PHN49_09410 [Candidatus Omnitrophica bacterium]|nr:hypothetical protein [Candidatus Omnitrophota bacterium]
MKLRAILICLIVLGAGLGGLASLSMSADDAGQDDVDVGVNKKGFVWNIAKDRRVEKVGGVYQPEGEDVYLSRRLEQLQGDIKSLQTQMTEIGQTVKDIKAMLQTSNKTLVVGSSK